MTKLFARAGIGVLGLVLIAATLVLWPISSAPLPDPENSRLITNVRVIDVVTGSAGEPTSIEIRNGKIAAIGPDLAGQGLVRIDARGAFAVPGFWDMHVHTFQSSPQMHLPLWIANGVTNLRDMMDCPLAKDTLIACAADKQGWNAAIAKGEMAGPRIVETASYYLESEDLSTEEVRARVAAADRRGIDAIKVYNRLSPTAYRAAAREARARKLRIVGHLPKAVPLESAISAGQTSFEHAHILPRHCFTGAADWRAGRLDTMAPTDLIDAFVTDHDIAACDAAIAALAKSRAWIVPTHVTREEDMRAGDAGFSEDARLDYLDPLSRWAWNDDLGGTRSAYPGTRGANALRRYFDHGLSLTGRAHAGGVGILVGTDTVIGGFRYHDEMAHLVRAGLTPAEVLRAATIDAARYAGMEESAGSITVGKRADLVLLIDNPLRDIANTRTIHAVVQAGRLYDRQRLDDLLEFTRKQGNAPHNWAKLLWGFARSSVSAEL